MTMQDIVFESPADQAGWVQMPNVVLMDATLSMQARLLYALLLHYARQDKACFPGQGTLAANLGVSDRSVREYITELEAAKLTERRQRGQGRTCLYVILALGLRAKRLKDSARKHTSGGSTVPGKPGSTLPTEVEAGTKTQIVDGERARASSQMKIRGKPVDAETWKRTREALDAFNAAAGKRMAAVTGTGQPSQAAKRVYQQLRDWPDLTLEQIADIVRRTLASRWWGDGPPSIGVVFGPNVFEDNLTRSEAPAGSSSRRNGMSELDRRRVASLESLMGGAA